MEKANAGYAENQQHIDDSYIAEDSFLEEESHAEEESHPDDELESANYGGLTVAQPRTYATMNLCS